MKIKIVVLLCFLIGSMGCRIEVDTPSAGAPTFNGEGYRPIYASLTEAREITTTLPQPLQKPGKIYVRGNYLFINEQGKGLHLIDNTDPEPPKLSFIKIPGNVDIAVKGNLLYANNGPDFVVLNIAEPTKILVVKRIENVFPALDYPLKYRSILNVPTIRRGCHRLGACKDESTKVFSLNSYLIHEKFSNSVMDCTNHRLFDGLLCGEKC
ncbi:MAG: hypothetical protein R2822_27575 [Spirosomataceae bacterium]